MCYGIDYVWFGLFCITMWYICMLRCAMLWYDVELCVTLCCVMLLYFMLCCVVLCSCVLLIFYSV